MEWVTAIVANAVALVLLALGTAAHRPTAHRPTGEKGYRGGKEWE